MKTLRLTYQLIAIPAAFSLSTCHTQSSQQQPTPPNIIYILADDMGYGDINAFNPHSQIPTPTLDSWHPQELCSPMPIATLQSALPHVTAR